MTKPQCPRCGTTDITKYKGISKNSHPTLPHLKDQWWYDEKCLDCKAHEKLPARRVQHGHKTIIVHG